MVQCKGRVFSRLRLYEALPEDTKREVEALEQYLTTNHAQVFEKHHPSLIKSTVSVRYSDLLEKVDEYRRGSSNKFAHQGSRDVDMAGAVPHDQSAHAHDGAKTTTTRPSGRTMRLVEGLIFKGFITPYNEDVKLANMKVRESFHFKAHDLFVPVAPYLRGLTESPTSVWDVASGAIYADVITRKANLIEKIKHGKDVYAVVDAHTHTLTLFDDDVSQRALVQIQAPGCRISEDTSYFTSGVKVWNDAASEIFSPSNDKKLEKFVNALRAIGIHGLEGVRITEDHHNASVGMTPGFQLPRGISNVTQDPTYASASFNQHPPSMVGDRNDPSLGQVASSMGGTGGTFLQDQPIDQYQGGKMQGATGDGVQPISGPGYGTETIKSTDPTLPLGRFVAP